ncbi:MAG: ferredoxin [Thermodesulfobacteriota bacterium]
MAESVASKVPVVDLDECILCGVCVEVCPAVFRENDAGYIEVAELAEYPEAEVDEAAKNCPRDCIRWEDR